MSEHPMTVLPVIDRTEWWFDGNVPMPDGSVGQRWRHARNRRWTVISSIEDYDGVPWVHVSTAMNNRLPGYYELKQVKQQFIGDERVAFQLFVPRRVHVNLHENCLHLWATLDGKDCPLPEFLEI